jgi:CheY-like chemotaxis protein
MSPPSIGPHPHALVDLTGITVLAVEDHPDSLDMLTAALRLLGADVLPARVSREAYELLRQHLPRLIISDIGLPDEDGCALIRRIRQLSVAQGGATPAIALSAYTLAEDRRKALEAGFHAYLTKPIELDRLVATISQLTRSAV